ncbi:MAG: DUF1080 domain-containing protein [Planctomycetia bacterium]|nr:DUF1080 domain-containing protein [Planctomycetia bacterium]
MKKSILTIVATLLASASLSAAEWKSGIEWVEPPVVDPGPETAPANVPSDAIVLFGGENMDAWNNGENWPVKDGVVYSGKGMVTSKQAFGSVQLHVEFATPSEVKGEGQGRGNSGVFWGPYEVQVLDSYINKTYFDGQCGSFYKQNPPAVNCCRKPGEWQTYDIIYMRPVFNEKGEVVRPMYVTVFQNGILVQNHLQVKGTGHWHMPPKYDAHAEKMPIGLQDHGNPVRFRNIWVREISDSPVQPVKEDSPVKPADVFGSQE